MTMEASHKSDTFDPEHIRFYCVAHDVTYDRKKALFLTRIGPKMYAKLKVWVSPEIIYRVGMSQKKFQSK